MEWFTSSGYWLSRLVFQRGLAAVYLIAFLAAAAQCRAPNAAPRCGNSPEVVRIAAGRGGNRPREQPLWSGSRHPATG